MAVRVSCDDPQKLLKHIKAAVRDGTVQTWQLDSDGDFTHTPRQWINQAWFRPKTFAEELIFNLLGQTSSIMSKPTYGVYHGRFIEMLLTHFDEEFDVAIATALPVEDDYVGEEP